MSIKVAIIGAGYMALEHAKAFSSIEKFKLVGVFSRTESKAITLASQFNTKAYKSIPELFDKTKAELVIVAVSELSVMDICREIFKYPWLCFLEKPVGYNYQQACEICELALEADHKPFVALNRRSYSSTRYALEYLKEDDSDIRLVSILDQQDMKSALETGKPELVIANYMFANSIHVIDYFNLFCRGEIDSVEPTIPWNAAKPTHVIATIKFSSGDIGIYQGIWNGPGPWSVSVTNTNYRIEMRPLESLKIQKKGERQLEEIATDQIDKIYKPGLYSQALQILNYFKGGSVALATLDDATRSMKLCSMIYR